MNAQYIVKLAQTRQEHQSAQALRYQVFVAELGGGGASADHASRLDHDAFDDHCDQLILVNKTDDAVVGVYRLLRGDQAVKAGGFYSEGEYNLAKLTGAGRPLLELGRSCLHADHRGGTALWHLWSALAAYVADHHIEILFGVASFRGTNADALAAPLSLLHHRYLAPDALRVRARDFTVMNRIDVSALDAPEAMRAVPPLIKSYLRLGGVVGEGAFVDHAFNTTDVCMILDTAKMNPRQARFYQRRTT